MHYKHALAIGDAEGVVQCTFAVIYKDNKGQTPLFSLQRKRFEDTSPFIKDLYWNNRGNESWGKAGTWDDNVATYTGYGKEALIGWDKGTVIQNQGLTGYTVVDFPLVKATKWNEGRYVPVTLVEEAVIYIKKTLMYAKRYNWYDYIDPTTGKTVKTGLVPKKEDERERVIKKAKRDGYTYKEYIDYSPQWRYLKKSVLNPDTVYYIKPAAFNWYPVNIKNTVDANGILITQEAQDALADLERAKKLLILAGGAALIS